MLRRLFSAGEKRERESTVSFGDRSCGIIQASGIGCFAQLAVRPPGTLMETWSSKAPMACLVDSLIIGF